MERNESAFEWKEGRHEFDVVLPVDKTKSGREETVRVGFSWEVVASGPMISRDRTQWEIDRAGELLPLVADESGHGEDFFDRHEGNLRGPLTHAVSQGLVPDALALQGSKRGHLRRRSRLGDPVRPTRERLKRPSCRSQSGRPTSPGLARV